MRILITNDDGINAPGLAVLEEIAAQIAGPDGEVWVVAPSYEQSGVGHCVSYTVPFRYDQHGPRRYSVGGTPADCVITAVQHIVEDPIDLVLSGVNSGNNAAENAVYSGTLGAAMEGALSGIDAIGLSQFYGPATKDLDDKFEAARAYGVAAVKACLKAGFPRQHDYKLFYSVNFPPLPAADVKGLKATPQGYRCDKAYSVIPHVAKNTRTYLFMNSQHQQAPTKPGTDAYENLAGWVSLTPMRADLCDRNAIAPLTDAIEGL